MPVTYMPEARADLHALDDYLAKSSPERAGQIFSEIDKRCNDLAAMPGIGVRCPDLGPDARKLVTPQKMVIFYREISGSEIEVLRVLDARQDLDRELQALRIDAKRNSQDIELDR